ncbi:MAG: hypothetical protein UU82_C0002G0033 [Candidatus Nomurabacteria bacterium GW2011_GWC2_41_8]|uniref:Uncharacterized protein n=3 Tax=Candidatus Nomuraibacteriota TaxID=1752729 RepID=A0A1F6YC50_9BACT|nr:MAG: hypothetical protein UU58_C0002G0036 [Candidatus Nomurabacteria bacterium GW2011_GWA2_41_25]KKS24668.1 MAG: hypothetical protein UU82_C0002G0033 [Candidatus Nomurabacteria bacterium GW2011_GWC2_41_8]OGI67037.1 MAG: hypothetical protein A2823_02330 [Candidatus Nomurabacteria bacterium RIFCSPHIGHO2_01_FULL_41_91]OGI80967.1 MAG: hypothetical protein A3D43_01915 [Candidatus Nomurabacteria bacterium RIFCSPHIGHO2_02_FULL_41_52]OGI84538.1 MAG: hypothetical protein A3F49_03010 [Candidatus Nomur
MPSDAIKSMGGAPEQLSVTLQQINGMELHYGDAEFDKLARVLPPTKEVSEDAFLRIAKGLIKGTPAGPNTWGAMFRILDRESIQTGPYKELFGKAMRELAAKAGHKIDDSSESQPEK